MSLVSTWVLATDGLMYRNPVLRDHDYFLCFDDYDPPELVVKAQKKRQSEARAKKILQSLGVGYTNLRHNGWSGRCFAPGKWTVVNGDSWFLELTTPIPVDKIHNKSKGWLFPDNGGCLYYCGQEEVAKARLAAFKRANKHFHGAEIQEAMKLLLDGWTIKNHRLHPPGNDSGDGLTLHEAIAFT